MVPARRAVPARTGHPGPDVGPVVMKRSSLVAALAIVGTLTTPTGAAAQSPPRVTSRQPLVDGLRHQTFDVKLDDGAVARGNVVRVARSAHLRVEPVHAKGTIKGTARTSAMARRELRRGGLAAINAGFWLPAAGGKPHGVAATDHVLFASPQTQWGRPGHRGTVGIRDDGSTIFTRVGGRLRLRRPGTRAAITDLNYIPLKVGGDGSGELLAYTPDWGPTATAPRGSKVVTLTGLSLPVLGSATARVAKIRATSGAVAIPPGGGVLVGYGRARKRLADLRKGGTATIDVDIVPEDVSGATWGRAADALPGGPLIVRKGKVTPSDDWVAEGFSHEVHNGPRHPRSAIARTRDGTVLLVTVDGRQQHSAGMTMWELARLLIDMGAVHGLSLDGGGSTTMTVLGRIRNRYSDPMERPVASTLVARYRPRRTVRDAAKTACRPARVPTPSFTDITGTAHEAAIACAAWYALAAGIDDTRYAPQRPVTRAQMASFLARMVDHVATHPGAEHSGRALPDPRAAFADVPSGSPHAAAIRRLAAADIVTGGPGGLPASRYGPGLTVTRAQMASLLDRTLTHIRGAPLRAGGNVFADDTGSVHEAAANRLARAGIAQGRSPGLLRPDGAVSRGAMASFLMRTVELLAAQGTTTAP